MMIPVGFWEQRVVPRLVDATCGTGQVDRLRARLCEGLSGRVLEIGFGSGLSVPHYPDTVTSVDAVDPSDVAWEMSARRRAEARVPVSRVGADAERVDAEDETYHCVLSTFTLCTVPDAAAALSEVRRVLVPGGSLFFLEHGRAPTARVQHWQRRLEPVQRRLAGGCHLTRDTPALVRGAGLEVTELHADYLPGPSVTHPWAYVFRGRAVRTD